MDDREFFMTFVKKAKVEYVKSTLERAWEAGLKPRFEVCVHGNDKAIMVPSEHVKGGFISLVLGVADIRDYHFDEVEGIIHFSASFGGKPTSVSVPVAAIAQVVVNSKLLVHGFPVWVDMEGVKPQEESKPAPEGNVVDLFKGKATKH
ncbi:MAG: hypothetical protein ACRCTP_04270 [Aeromonas popoffii]|uniref:hypothetical protein n=1 Tax=Aeromonas popoffii TaxID=70856 RepID=UPI003F3D98A9